LVLAILSRKHRVSWTQDTVLQSKCGAVSIEAYGRGVSGTLATGRKEGMLRISQMRPLSAPLARAARPRSYHGRSILRHSTSLDGASERPGCHARGGGQDPLGRGPNQSVWGRSRRIGLATDKNGRPPPFQRRGFWPLRCERRGLASQRCEERGALRQKVESETSKEKEIPPLPSNGGDPLFGGSIG